MKSTFSVNSDQLFRISHNSSMIASPQGNKLTSYPLFVIPVKILAILTAGQLATFLFYGDQPENDTLVAQVLGYNNAYPTVLQEMCKPHELMCQHVFKASNLAPSDYLLLISSFHKNYIAYYSLKVHIR
jgi:hypothetical protein